MLLKMSKLTGDKRDERAYINTRMILAVGAIEGYPESTLIKMVDDYKSIIKKPVEEVIEELKEHSPDLWR